MGGAKDFQGLLGTLTCNAFGDCGIGRSVIRLHRDSGVTQPLEAAAAVRAALARRENPLLARHMVRKRAALGLVLGGGRRLGKHFRRPRDLLVVKPELKLVEGLRGGGEALPAQAGKLVPELLDQKIAVAQLRGPRRQLGPRGQHHRLQRGDVVGQPLRATGMTRPGVMKTIKPRSAPVMSR